jgi:hypothetical protein
MRVTSTSRALSAERAVLLGIAVSAPPTTNCALRPQRQQADRRAAPEVRPVVTIERSRVALSVPRGLRVAPTRRRAVGPHA